MLNDNLRGPNFGVEFQMDFPISNNFQQGRLAQQRAEFHRIEQELIGLKQRVTASAMESRRAKARIRKTGVIQNTELQYEEAVKIASEQFGMGATSTFELIDIEGATRAARSTASLHSATIISQLHACVSRPEPYSKTQLRRRLYPEPTGRPEHLNRRQLTDSPYIMILAKHMRLLCALLLWAASLDATISALGRILPSGGVVDIWGPSGLQVNTLHVTQGQEVEANSLLASLSNQKQVQADLEQAELALEHAKQAYALEVDVQKAILAGLEVDLGNATKRLQESYKNQDILSPQVIEEREETVSSIKNASRAPKR